MILIIVIVSVYDREWKKLKTYFEYKQKTGSVDYVRNKKIIEHTKNLFLAKSRKIKKKRNTETEKRNKIYWSEHLTEIWDLRQISSKLAKVHRK